MDDSRASRASSADRRPRRWLCRLATALLALVLLLAGVGWFLPSIVVATSLKDSLVRAAIPQFRGEVVLGEVSLGWLSPIRISGLTVRDEHGEPLAEAAEVATEKTLWALLLDSRNVGPVHLHQPAVYCAVREGGSTLEDALAPLLSGPAGGGAACVLYVDNGKCIVREQGSGREFRLSEIDAEATISSDTAEPLSWRLSAKASDEAATGELSTEGRWSSGADTWGVGQATVETRSLPLAVLAPMLTRFGVQGEIAGRADLRGAVTLADGGRRVLSVEQLAIEHLSAHAPQHLGSDTMQLERLDASGEAEFSDETVTLRQGRLACDLGRVQVSGQTRWKALSAQQFVAALRTSSFDVDGEIDLARVARHFPATLRLREGLTVTSGVVQIACATRDNENRRRWEGSLSATNLAATHQGRSVAWEHPLAAEFAVHDAPEGPVLDQFSCQSEFLNITGRGSLAAGGVTLRGDLSKLAAELQQFVDLDEMQLAGSVEGELQWRTADAGRTSADGAFRLSEFQWSAPGRRPWREPQLTATFAAVGVVNENGVQRLESGNLDLQAGGDTAHVQLRGPVDAPGATSTWPVQGEVRGELASWLPRLQNVVSLPSWNVEGQVVASGAGVVSTREAKLDSVAVSIDQLYLDGAGLLVREPRIEAKADLAWDGQKQSLAARQATFASSSLAFRAQNVAATLPPSAFTASGEIDFRGDLQRVSQWLHDPQNLPTQSVTGMATGRLTARRTAEGIEAQGTTDIENFAYRVPARIPVPALRTTPAAQSIAWTTLWQERKLHFVCDATYSPDADALDIRQFSAAGDAVQLQSHGKVQELSTSCRADLSGQCDYDLEKLLTLLRPHIGPDLKMTGRGPRPFTLQGPLRSNPNRQSHSPIASGGPLPATAFVPPELTASTSLAWSTAEYSGVKAGAGETAIELAGGIVTLGPLDMPVSEGRLTIAPKVSLNTTPMLLSLGAGPVLQNVRISPEMCRTWLKYMAPLVADAAQAEGRFSLALVQPAHFPLDAPPQGEARGALTIHSAQVGPGPLSRQFLTLAEQVKAAVERKPFAAGSVGASPWLNMPEQTISFEMARGRVYHRDLQVVSRDVTIRTRGSVGMDQTIDLLAEVPVQDRWVDKEPLLAGFRGQALQVPVSGTLTAPRLDGRVAEQFARQMLGDAAKRLLEQNLKANPDVQRTLEQFFKRPQ